VRLNYNYGTKIRKEDSFIYIYIYIDKIPSDIILKAVRTAKIHNLSIQQTTLEFNMNYCTLSGYCKKL